MSVITSRAVRRWCRAVLLVVALAVPAPVAAQGDCVVTVEPASGAPGTTFTIGGHGFGEPAELTITRDGVVLVQTEVELDSDTGSFTYPFTPDPSDLGTYVAEAITPETECGDRVTFALLPAGDTEPPDTAPSSGMITGAVLAMVALIALAVLLTGRLRARDR